MNTTALESLASASRERLIEMAVAAIERKTADPLLSDSDREKLKQAVGRHAEASGGRVLGAAKVVAYSWFNRLTALRYMDAMELSGIYGVVTPRGGIWQRCPRMPPARTRGILRSAHRRRRAGAGLRPPL